jgi:hypothetical protein
VGATRAVPSRLRWNVRPAMATMKSACWSKSPISNSRTFATEIQQRRNAENRLTDYLGQLENIVSARTAELKAINARLSQSNRGT